MNVRLTQIDGALPNLALMRLAYHYRTLGAQVHLTRDVERGLFEPRYDHVYGSTIFKFSAERVAAFRRFFPEAVVGGTGSGSWVRLEDVVGGISDRVDYSDYPRVDYSIGFLQRGCRLNCGFCVVPKKEGSPFYVKGVDELWRGEPWPKKLHILDNDFFGVPQWREQIEHIKVGGFRVCLSQGINVRLINEDAATALASIQYRDSKFRVRRLYTAWDNLGNEKVFFRGIDMLNAAGIPSKHLLVYMLVGYAKGETWDDIHYRFNRMVERGLLPYPMVYDMGRRDLRHFQRWAVRGLYRAVPFSEYEPYRKEFG